MSPTPVGDHEAGEFPVVFEHLSQQILVFAGEVAVDRVIRAHHSGRVANAYSNFKRKKIGFVESTNADDGIDFVAAALLIVDRIVLNVADHVLRLFALDAVANQCSGQYGIFPHVFEGAAVAWFAGYVCAATERHVVALGPKLAADQCSIFASGLRIPTRGGAHVGRKRR